MLPLSPGRAERHGFEYFRHGTLSLYAAFNTKTGEVLGKTATRHTSARLEQRHEVPYSIDVVRYENPQVFKRTHGGIDRMLIKRFVKPGDHFGIELFGQLKHGVAVF